MKRAHEHPALASLGSVKYWPAFNLFRHKLKPDLICAVPEDYPVPGFIEGSTWAFAGKVSEPITIPLGFKSKAAEAGVRFNGFYLFQASPIERGVESRTGAVAWALCGNAPFPVSAHQTGRADLSGSSAIAGFRPHRSHRAALPQWALQDGPEADESSVPRLMEGRLRQWEGGQDRVVVG